MDTARGWRERFVPEGVRNRLRELEQSEPEVRLLRQLLGEERLLAWALSIGSLRYPGLRSGAPPLPPEALRGITAEAPPELFLWTGLVDAETVLRLAHEHGSRGDRARPRLLDFGCGCGRVLRFLVGHADLFELHGTDVHPEHVRWCREFLAPIAFGANGPRPPWPTRTATSTRSGPCPCSRTSTMRRARPGARSSRACSRPAAS
jgi:hypothetical protein